MLFPDQGLSGRGILAKRQKVPNACSPVTFESFPVWTPHGFRQVHGPMDIAQCGPYCAKTWIMHGRVVVVIENQL